MKPARPTPFRAVPSLLALALAVLAGAPALAAEFPPKELENLQVLPKGIEVPELMSTMREFSMGLGVRCQHCHEGEPGAPLSEIDFKSDAKEAKRKARAMLRMTKAINGSHLAELGVEGGARITVQCVTCHRGQQRPALLGDVLTAELNSEGLAAAVAKYRELRAKYYGSHSFDFSEWTLISLGDALARGGRTEPAEALLKLNLEYFQESTSSWDFLAELYRRQGRLEEAKAAVAEALAIDPEDRRAKQILAAIEAAVRSVEEREE